MLGRVLKIGCFVVIGSILLTGCLLSSSIEQHMAADYQDKAASIKAQSQVANPDPAQQLAILQVIVETDKQEAARYNLLLLGVVVVVLVASALVISTATLYFNTRYIRPIEKKFDEVLATGRMWRMNGQQQSPFSNTTAKAYSSDETLPHRPNFVPSQAVNRDPAKPHCDRLPKHYKVNDKWTL